MKQTLLFLLALTIFSCVHNGPTPPVVQEAPEAPDSLRFCGTIAPTNAPKTDKRAVGNPPAYWPQNKTLKIGFLNNPTAAQVLFFKTCVAEIDTITNLNVTYPTSGPYDIRVAFSPNSSWSHIGKNASYITDQTKATLNVGWGWNDKNAAGIYTQGVVRHEFLHAIGMMHEMCNPNGGICWMKENVYADLLASNGWDRATVDFNFFFLCTGSAYQSSTYDKTSVGHYTIIARWTCNNTAIPGNNFMSEKDIAFWSGVYPKVNVPIPPIVTGITLTPAQVQLLMANAISTRDLTAKAVTDQQAALNAALAAKASALSNYNTIKSALGQ